jgi:hypothetical protein
MMKNALVALLLTLAGHAGPSSTDAPSTPAALIAEHPGLTPALLVGAWHGTERLAGAAAPSPLEIAFADGVRPSTIFGYFIFGDSRVAPRLRRLGTLNRNRVTFELPDGRGVALWLESGGRRLVGNLADHGRDSAILLSRVREEAWVDGGALPRAALPDMLIRPGAPLIDVTPGRVTQR